MTSFTVRYPEIGRCMCGTVLYVDSFRDARSYQDFYRSGLCQGCSDEATLCVSPHASGRRLRLRRGAVVAHRSADDGGVELCLLPFLFVAEEWRIAWEARYIVRIGPCLEPLDPFDELLPMKDHLDGHQVCVHEGESLRGAPGPAEHLTRLDVLLGPDRMGLEAAVGTGVFPAGARCMSLADGFPWRRELGRPLLPLGRWWPYDEGPLSTLRACALMGFALCWRGPDGESGSPFRQCLSASGGAVEALAAGSFQTEGSG